MTKYYEGVLYKGNIVKNNNNRKEIIEESYLIYSKNRDCFYSYKVLNELLDLELNRHLTKEEKEKLTIKIEDYTYNYYKHNDSNMSYVDENTIVSITQPPEAKHR